MSQTPPIGNHHSVGALSLILVRGQLRRVGSKTEGGGGLATRTVSVGNGGSDKVDLRVNIRPDLNTPERPESVGCVPGDKQVTIEWGWTPNERITGYQIWRKDDPKWQAIEGSDWRTTEHTVTGLKLGTLYKFRIRAMIRENPGQASRMVQARPTEKKPNQAPRFDRDVPSPLVFEQAKRGTVVYDLNATDPDGGPISFSLTGPDADHFEIDDKGVITVASKKLGLPGRSNFSFGAEVVEDTGSRDTISLGGYVNPKNVPLFATARRRRSRPTPRWARSSTRWSGSTSTSGCG